MAMFMSLSAISVQLSANKKLKAESLLRIYKIYSRINREGRCPVAISNQRSAMIISYQLKKTEGRSCGNVLKLNAESF
jgi:hypothetical protein